MCSHAQIAVEELDRWRTSKHFYSDGLIDTHRQTLKKKILS